MMDYYEKNSCDKCYEVRKVRIIHHSGEDVLALCSNCAPRLHKANLPTGKSPLKLKNNCIKIITRT